MALRELQIPWDRQPEFSERADNPDLVALWRPGITVFDAHSQREVGQFTDSSSEVSPPVNSVSVIGRTVTTFHDVMVPTVNVDTAESDSVSIIAWIQPLATSLRYFVARGRDGLGAGWSVRLGTNDNVPHFYIVHTGGGTAGKALNATTDISSNGAWVCGVYEQGVGTRIYVNGALEGTNSFANTTLRSSTRGWYLGGPLDKDILFADTSYGKIGDVAIVRRALAAQEVARDGGAPWWLFNPQRIWVPVSAASASLPTLGSGTAINITSTGWRPRVTLTY